MVDDLPPAVAVRAEKPSKRRHPGKPKSHKAMPGTDQPNARAAYVAQEFRDTAEKAAAAGKRADPESGYEPGFEARRERSLYSLSQLKPDQVAAIEVDYRAGLKPINQLCDDHGIVKSTLYALAEKRGWPLRSQIQRQMAEAVQEKVVQAVAADLRMRQSGDPSQPVNPSGLAALVDTATQTLLPAGDRGAQGEPLTSRALEEMGNQDLLVEEYAIQSALVLVKHREMAGAAVKACDDLITVQRDAIARAKQRAELLADSPGELAKLLEPLVKTIASTVTTMQRAIDLQRQAFALEDTAGKGLSFVERAQVGAVRAGFLKPNQLPQPPAAGEDPPSPGNDAGAEDAIPLPAGVGTYEALIREAERRGVVMA